MDTKRKKRLLAGLLVFACIAQGFFIFKRVHNYPFVIYDMYSRPEMPAGRSAHYLIIADSDTIYPTSFPMLAEGRLINNLKIYQSHDRSGADYWDPALTSRQQRWQEQILPGKWLLRRADRLLRQDPDGLREFPAWLHGLVENHLDRTVQTMQVIQVIYDRNTSSVTRASEVLNYPARR